MIKQLEAIKELMEAVRLDDRLDSFKIYGVVLAIQSDVIRDLDDSDIKGRAYVSEKILQGVGLFQSAVLNEQRGELDSAQVLSEAIWTMGHAIGLLQEQE